MLAFNNREKADLEAHGIEAVVLFGSQAQETAGPLSDFDFGILVKDPATLYSAEKRRKIYDVLYDLLSGKIRKLVDIDIVFLEDAPMELQAHAAQYGIVLYERTKHSFCRYRERVINLAADFAPFRSLFHKAILSRIP